ncbi:MAG: uL15 family ribosomal protein, partial [Clostridia bacterium]
KGIVKTDGKSLTIDGAVVSEANIIAVKTQKSGLLIGIINFFGTTAANIVSLVILVILGGTSFVKVEPKTEEEIAEKERRKSAKQNDAKNKEIDKEKKLEEEKADREIREANKQKEKENKEKTAQYIASEKAKERERILQEEKDAQTKLNQEKLEKSKQAEQERAEKAQAAEKERLENEQKRAIEKERKKQEDKIKAAAILAANSEKSYDESDFADELEDNDDDDDYIPEKDEMKITSVDKISGKVILVRYNKSFLAKLIQSTNEVKSFYSEIKNHILSYEKISNRLSWSYDSYNTKGKQLVKLNIRGKTLCAYLALNSADYDYNKYFQADISDVKKYANVPMKIKIKSERGLKYAIELVDEVMKNNEIQFLNEQTEDYVAKYPYQSIEELIELKLVKELVSEETMEAARLAMEYMSNDEDDGKIISVEMASKLMTDEIAKEFIEKSDKYKSLGGKLGEINVETINNSFEDGDTVTIESLHEKGLLPMKFGRVKILARGELDKKLTIIAEDFSYSAVKMIVFAGGKAIVRTK